MNDEGVDGCADSYDGVPVVVSAKPKSAGGRESALQARLLQSPPSALQLLDRELAERPTVLRCQESEKPL